MNKLNFLFLLFSISALFSCQNFGPNPQSIVGKYEVSFSLSEDAIDKDAIKESINEAKEDATEDIEEAKRELAEDLDISQIDTSTLEGKVEYAAKIFSKSVAEAGLNLGGLGKDLGGLFSGIAGSSLDFTSALLKNLTIEVELQADGDIKANKSTFINLGLNDAKWKVEGEDFMIYDGKENKEDQRLKISNQSSHGFDLKKDDVTIHFKKIKE